MGERDAEHMQDYLARLDRQLSEMENHFQSVAPRREGLARATERYLQRKASAVDPTPSAGAATAAPVSLSAQSSVCRRQSADDAVPGPSILPHPHGTANIQLRTDAICVTQPDLHLDSVSEAVSPDAQLPATSRSNLDSPSTEMPHTSLLHSPALQTPPRGVNKQSNWEPQSEHGPSLKHQASPARVPLFLSPQGQRGKLSRAVSESGSRKGARSKHGFSSMAAAFEAAAACAEEVEGSRVCILSRNASEAGSKAGSRLPSFKSQQPSPSATPEKAGRKAVQQRPPRNRARSQGGYPLQQQQQPPSAAKLATSTTSNKLPILHGSSSSSPSGSRTMRRFASTGGVYGSGRTSDADGRSEDSSKTLETAASAAVAAAKTCSNSLEDPQSHHELLAVIHDAIEAATAAVNKPDVLISSPGGRRMTADEVPMARSRSENGNSGSDRTLQRHGSSLKGLAVAAAGWSRAEDQAAAAGLDQEASGDQLQQQQHPVEAQHLGSTDSAVSEADIVADKSLCDSSACRSEIEVPIEQDMPLEFENGAARQKTVPHGSAIDAAGGGGVVGGSDVAELMQPAETPWPRLGSPDAAAAAGGGATSSSSPSRRAVSDSGYTQQQQGTPDKNNQLSGSGARKRWATPSTDKQQHEQEQQTGTPMKQQQSWTPTKSLRTLKTWFSEVRRSPLKNDDQHSLMQDRKHVSETGFDPTAAAAGGGGGGDSRLRSVAHSRAASVGNLLGAGGLEDMPLHLLGQSGSVRTRSSAGSQLSSTPAAAAAADTPGHVTRNSRNSSGSGSSVLDGQTKQQQRLDRFVGSVTPSTAPVRIPATSISAECAPTTTITTTSAPAPAAAAALHSSAPGLLESPQEGDKSSTAASSSMAAAAEQDEVLFGSPAGSPASSHSHLHFTMKMAWRATASPLSMDATAAAATVTVADEDDMDRSDWGQDSWQQQHQFDDEAGDLPLLASPTAAAADRNPPEEVAQVEPIASDSDIGSPASGSASAGGSSITADDDQSAQTGQSPEPEQIMIVEPRAQKTILHHSSHSSSSNSFEISTDLGSSSSSGSLASGSPVFGGTGVASDHAVEPGSPTSSQIRQLLEQIDETAADLDDTQQQHQPAAAAVSAAAAGAVPDMTSFKISISPEASTVEEDIDLQQQQQQQQQNWHPAGAAAAAAAVAGLAAGANYERSFLGHHNAEPSGDIVVEGHSMQLPDYELEQAVPEDESAAAAAAADDALQIPAAAQWQHQQQKGGSQAQAVRQSEIEVALPEELPQQQQQQQQQQSAQPQLNHASNKGSGAGVSYPAAAAAAAKPSWSERMLGKLTSALKGSSNGRQRVKHSSKSDGDNAAAAAAAVVAPMSIEQQPVATRSRETSSTSGNTQHMSTALPTKSNSSQLTADKSASSSAQQSIHQSEHQSLHLPQPEPLRHQATDLPVTQLATLQQQQQQKSSMPSSTAASSSTSSSSSEAAKNLQLARAAAVAVAGVGVAAVQGTPPPHLVSCGSTLHAPTLAAVSLLLASTSCAAASSSSGPSPAVLAVSAASLAVAAAAAVAAWELDAVDLAVLGDSDVSMHPTAAAAAAGPDTSHKFSHTNLVDDCVTDSVTTSVSNTPATARYRSNQQLAPGGIVGNTGPAISPARAEKHPALQSHTQRAPAAGASFASTPQGLAYTPAAAAQSAAAAAATVAELSVGSSSNMTGLPELLSDVSKAQYSRPSSALGYDARRYTEPVSPMQALSGETAVSAADDSSPPEVQQQQQQKAENAQMRQELPQQQHPGQQDKQQQHQVVQQVDLQQQHRKQLSGHSWSGQGSPKTADVVWMPQKASLWESNQQQQQKKMDRSSAHQSAFSGGGSSSRALSAVQQLKQRQWHRRSSIGAVSNSSAGAEAETAAALHTSQQQQQRVQHQLPSAGSSELCLGHGVMGELTGQQQQQQQWCSQQQQEQQQSPQQELSCTDYYRQLVQQQEALEQQRQQHSSSIHPPGIYQQGMYTAPPTAATAAVVAAAPEGADGAASAGSRQLSALAKLRQQQRQRITRQQSCIGNGGATAGAAAALRSHSAAAAGEWGSAGGTEQQELQDHWQQHPLEVKTAWGDTTTAAREYIPQEQQQQQPDSRNTAAAATSPDPAAAAGGGRSGHNRGWSSDTGAGVAGDAGDDPAAAGGSSGSGSKPFLRRRSRTIASQKLDWSNVQSKTVHKLDDRCIPPVKSRNAVNSRPSYDPALAAAQRRAGLWETASKAAAVKRGSSTNRTNRRSPSYETAYEVERQSSTFYRPNSKGKGGLSSVHSDGLMSQMGPAAGQGLQHGNGRSKIPAMPGAGFSGAGAYSRHAAAAGSGYGAASGGARSPLKMSGSFQQGSSIPGVNVQRQLSARRSSGGGFGSPGLDPEAPLDDLLSHVNSLIKEFDRMYK